jgi:hypothetical protein
VKTNENRKEETSTATENENGYKQTVKASHFYFLLHKKFYEKFGTNYGVFTQAVCITVLAFIWSVAKVCP